MKKSIFLILSSLISFVVGAVSAGYRVAKCVSKTQSEVDKYKEYYNMLNQWLILKQEGNNLDRYFLNKGYKTIAIYGMGDLGNRLYDELKSTSIEVKYAIDKNGAARHSDVKVFDLSDELDSDIDVIVITPIFAYDEIEQTLMSKYDKAIVSLEDVVYGIWPYAD